MSHLVWCFTPLKRIEICTTVFLIAFPNQSMPNMIARQDGMTDVGSLPLCTRTFARLSLVLSTVWTSRITLCQFICSWSHPHILHNGLYQITLRESFCTTSWNFQQSDVEWIASEYVYLELILVKNARHHSCHTKIFLGENICFMVEPPHASCSLGLTPSPIVNLRAKPWSGWTWWGHSCGPLTGEPAACS